MHRTNMALGLLLGMLISFTLVSFIAALILVSCDHPGSPPIPTPTTITTTIDLPRLDEPFSWDGHAIFSSFPLVGRNPDHIRAIYAQALGNGYTIGRVCAETQNWDGELPTVPADIEVVRSFLETVARIPGAQVLLITNCTLKGPVPFDFQDDWNTRVSQLAAGYRNVAIEVENEWRQCRNRGWGPYCADVSRIMGWIREVKGRGLQGGADDSFCGGGIFRHELLRLVSFPSFHPCRTDENDNPWDPAPGTLARLVIENRGQAVLSETVCYSDRFDGGLYTSDKSRVERYLSNCKSTPGCVWNFHSEDGLVGELARWMPRW